MTNALYDNAAYKMMTGTFNWLTTELALVALTGVPEYDPAHLTVADLVAAGAVVVGVSLPILGRTVATDGTGQTDTVVIPGITAGTEVTWFVLCTNNADINLGNVVLFVDEAEVIPFQANGLDITVQPDWTGQRGWFRP